MQRLPQTKCLLEVSLSLTSGNLRIVFNLEQVALINSYALDDPSRIVIDIKNTRISQRYKSSAFSPIKSIRAQR